MNLRHRLDLALQALERSPDARLDECRIGAPLEQDEIDVIEALTGAPPPPQLVDLLGPMNGVELRWSAGDEASGGASGSLNIVPLRSMVLGWSAPPGLEPLEGVLWSDWQPSDVLARLKRMRVFEPVAGEPKSIAFEPAQPEHLYLVHGESIDRIRPELSDAAGLLIDQLGAAGLREALILDNWQTAVSSLPSVRLLDTGR